MRLGQPFARIDHWARSATIVVAAIVVAAVSSVALAQPAGAPLEVQEGDYVIRDFHFRSGETLPELRMHYRALGKPARDAAGHVTNAVIVLHGTGGTGQTFIRPQFSGVLFTPGGLLDVARWYIIIPDSIGHGKSSKPSDGLHARFPKYDYDDMVLAQHELLTKGLGVDHLRLIIGTSMGCMQGFVWGETYPGYMDGLMPLACNAVQIAGRNRMWRKMSMDAITSDPAWKGGEYTEQPVQGLRAAEYITVIAGSAPLQMQKNYPTRDAADAWLAKRIDDGVKDTDANDELYQLNSSRNYDPSAKLEQITAHVMWVNSADDFINPPELGLAQKMVGRLKHGRFVLLPITDQTRGHGTHTMAAVWKDDLAQLLKEIGG